MFNLKKNKETNNAPAAGIMRLVKKTKPMERVQRGEPFLVVGDRFNNRYRFDKVDAQHWALCWNNLIVAVATAGNFFPEGFILNMRVLGQVARLQVLSEDIRFAADVEEGGAR